MDSYRQQQQDEEERLEYCLGSLERVYKAGLANEAWHLAAELGLKGEFRQVVDEINHRYQEAA